MGRSVAAHLRISLEEYDARIRTYVPFYEDMLDEAARAVDAVAGEAPTLLDLGMGTAALSERCLDVRPRARVVGLDTDPGMLEIARARLAARTTPDLREASYLEGELPRADVVMASISLHHVPDPAAKRALYGRCRAALEGGGAMVLADCYPPLEPALARAGMAAWRRHLERSYSAEEAAGHLEAWSDEDTYFPLATELEWLGEAGFRPEVVWRRDAMGVLLCR